MDIKVLNNAFELDYQQYLYNQCRNASYKIGWNDTGLVDTSNRVYFHCPLNKEILDSNKIEEKIRNTEFGEYLQNYKTINGVVNCSRPGETYFSHSHKDDEIIVLYYPNLRWNKEWGGETMFYQKNTGELIFASEYIPNRLLLFKASIPHSVRAPVYISDQFRFTIAVLFKLNKK